MATSATLTTKRLNQACAYCDKLFESQDQRQCCSSLCNNRFQAAKRLKHLRYDAMKKIAKGMPQCVNCGCNDIAILEVNHIERNVTEQERRNSRRFYIDIISGARPTIDLEILCKLCNWLHYMNALGYSGWLIQWQPQQ